MSESTRTARRVDQAAAGIAFRILGETVRPELRIRMRQLPMRLRGSGLAATYAFVLSKADPQGDELERAYHRLAERDERRYQYDFLVSMLGDARQREERDEALRLLETDPLKKLLENAAHRELRGGRQLNQVEVRIEKQLSARRTQLVADEQARDAVLLLRLANSLPDGLEPDLMDFTEGTEDVRFEQIVE